MRLFRIWPRQNGKTLALARQSKHLIPYVSDRGFLFMPSTNGTHGDLVGVSESSDASKPCIWMRATGTIHNGQVSVHYPLEEAAKLRDQLTYLIENHYQVKPR
jgi:hypothetical protein